jgi:hypothetical protein
LEENSGVQSRRLRGIVAGEYNYINLTQADKILSAIGHPEYLHNGTIKIVANPTWTEEQWHEYMEERGCV